MARSSPTVGLIRTLQQARHQSISYGEVGGWALAREYRNTRAALELVIGSYAWAKLFGDCVCSCTATVRNNSASILKRLGAEPIRVEDTLLPPYFDPQYDCVMELLTFDSRQLCEKYKPLLNQVLPRLQESTVTRAERNETEYQISQDLTSLEPAILSAYGRGSAPLAAVEATLRA